MQDRFVGDVGDFGKYGLLRALTGLWPPLPPKERLSLGVVWYYREEKGLDYLKSEEYCTCDEELFSHINAIITGSKRTIAEIKKSGILGSETAFYATPVPQGKNKRNNWISGALEAMQERDIVFIDPDNGLRFTDGMSSKHVLLSEVQQFINRGQSIVTYQSFWRQNHDEQMTEWAQKIHRELQLEEQPRIMRFGPRERRRARPQHIPRAFIILPAVRHANLIDERLTRMLDGPWRRHFTQHTVGGQAPPSRTAFREA